MEVPGVWHSFAPSDMGLLICLRSCVQSLVKSFEVTDVPGVPPLSPDNELTADQDPALNAPDQQVYPMQMQTETTAGDFGQYKLRHSVSSASMSCTN